MRVKKLNSGRPGRKPEEQGVRLGSQATGRWRSRQNIKGGPARNGLSLPIGIRFFLRNLWHVGSAYRGNWEIEETVFVLSFLIPSTVVQQTTNIAGLATVVIK